jgi:hypothetical protein
MQTFQAAIGDERRPVPEAKRFSHYIGGVRYWFAVHPAPDYVASLSVSHWDSGKRACLITPTERAAAVGMDDKALAKVALDKLVTKHGAARVASVLRTAEA